MNMNQSMLDTMTSSGGANRTDADGTMKELASYVFPITEDDNPTSSTIQKRLAAKDEYGISDHDGFHSFRKRQASKQYIYSP